MKKFPKILSAFLAVSFMLLLPISTSAAQVESVQTKAVSEASLLAADFEVVGTKLESETTLPSYYSSKDLGYVTPVRNQLYNTCWAYGSLATLESSMMKNSYSVEQFSPMHMNHWGTKRHDGTGWQRTYIDGGYSFISLGYLTSWQGPRLESDYSETVKHPDFKQYDATAKKQMSVNSCIYLDTKDVETVKTAIYNYGAVVGNYHVNDSYYNPSTSAYFCNEEGLLTSQLNGHCISIVGWDDNYSKDNFVEGYKPENDGAWICKNSWGDFWGDMGYYWISYEDEYLFDTKFGHSYAFIDYEKYSDQKTLYQNEIDGATYEFDYVTNFDTITYINVFDTEQYKNLIEKVNFETTSQGAQYRIYTIPLDTTGKPVRQQSRWEEIASGTVDYCGYHSIDTKDFRVNEDKFAIGVKLTKNNGSTNTIGVSEWLSTGGDYIYLPQSQKGQSYMVFDASSPVDAMDFYKDQLDDSIGGTFVIKAIGHDDAIIGDVDMDSMLSIMDVTDIQRYLADLKEFSDRQLYLANSDGDEVVSIFDATLIQMKLASLFE